MGSKSIFFVVFLAIASFVLYISAFVVNEKETALKLKFGEVVRSGYEPGLYFKIPGIENVVKYDKRILNLDAKPQKFLTSEKKNVMVDSFVKWKIIDPTLFYTKVRGDESQANNLLSQIVNGGLRDEFGKKTIQELVSSEDRINAIKIITSDADKAARKFGINVVDVRVKRIDLPPRVSGSVFERMRADREKVANEFRAEGKKKAEEIRADADMQSTIILSTAYKESERIRGEGDAEATKVYAEAYEKDIEFFSFYRSLNAYKESFNSKSDILLLKPDSEFFKHFGGNAVAK